MKDIKRIFLILLSLLFISGNLVASGDQEGGSESESGPVTIEMWYSVGGNPQEATKALTDMFNASQDEVFVNAVYSGGYAETTQKLLAAVVADNTPDIAHMAMALTSEFIVNGYFEGLNSYFEKDPNVDQDDYVDGELELLTYKGEIYGIPFNWSNPILFYNKDLFRKAGLDPENPPTTWEEIAIAAEAIDSLGDDIYGINISRQSGWLSQGYTWQHGNDWIAEDNSRVLWTEPGAIAALTTVKDIVDNSGIYEAEKALLVSGNVGMFFYSCAGLTGLIRDCEFDLGVAVQPKGVKQSVPTGGGSLYVFENISEEKKAAAWKYLTYMSNMESQIYWAKQTGYLVSNKDAQNSEEMKELFTNDPRYTVPYQQLPYATIEDRFMTIPFQKVRDIFNAAWDESVFNDIAPEKALAEAAEKADAVLSKYY